MVVLNRLVAAMDTAAVLFVPITRRETRSLKN